MLEMVLIGKCRACRQNDTLYCCSCVTLLTVEQKALVVCSHPRQPQSVSDVSSNPVHPAIFKTPQLDVLLGNVLCSYLAPGADGLHRRVNGRQCGKRQTLGFLFCTSPSLLYPRVRCSDVHQVPDNTRFYFCAVNECM